MTHLGKRRHFLLSARIAAFDSALVVLCLTLVPALAGPRYKSRSLGLRACSIPYFPVCPLDPFLLPEHDAFLNRYRSAFAADYSHTAMG